MTETEYNEESRVVMSSGAQISSEVERVNDLEKLDSLALVFALEKHILEQPQIDIKALTEHDFCHGVYARTMRLPAFTALTGAIHSQENFFVMRIGAMLVTTDDAVKQIGPGEMFVTKAGSKRAGFTLTDCVLTTFHANPDELREEAEILDAYILDPPEWILEYLETARRVLE